MIPAVQNNSLNELQEISFNMVTFVSLDRFLSLRTQRTNSVKELNEKTSFLSDVDIESFFEKFGVASNDTSQTSTSQYDLK